MAYLQGLSTEFVEALNRLHTDPKGDWWRGMLKDPELFAAIRNNYLNVYYRGCSLAKITLDCGAVIAETHYKYLLKPNLRNPYLRAAAGVFEFESRWPGGLADVLTSTLSDLAALKATAKVYAGDEKKFVGKVIRSHANVVDVEIALTKEAEEATDADPAAGASAKRIDIAALRWEDGRPVLDFYEAKLFDNKEIRAEGDAKVLTQIATYETLLGRYDDDIRRGFVRSCENVVALDGMPEDRRSMARSVVAHAAGLTVNPLPFLIVGGFDKDQRDGPVWAQHRQKLTSDAALGKSRVLLAGAAGNVKLGRGIALVGDA